MKYPKRAVDFLMSFEVVDEVRSKAILHIFAFEFLLSKLASAETKQTYQNMCVRRLRRRGKVLISVSGELGHGPWSDSPQLMGRGTTSRERGASDCVARTINQSTNQPTNQPTNQSTNRPTSQPVSEVFQGLLRCLGGGITRGDAGIALAF